MSRKLHIGGVEQKDGWEILNALPGPLVDHNCNTNDMSMFEDNTFSEIYGSHILEHLDYARELGTTLKEWLRILEPGGKAYISVPDMDILAQLFLMKDKIDMANRYKIMRVMFGGHIDEYDYHNAGLNFEFLNSFLQVAGFTNVVRVKSFGFFSDTSDFKMFDIPISVNLTAQKPTTPPAS